MADWKGKKNKVIEIDFEKPSSSNPGELKAIFGVVTDIQYADCNDRAPKNGKPSRQYRNSLNLLDDAVQKWKAYESAKSNMQLDCVVQLGDFVDRRSMKRNSRKAVDAVLARLDAIRSPDRKTDLLHVWGNHDLDCFKRADLLQGPLNSARHLYEDAAPCASANYYSHELSANLRLICLDLYEFSLLGYSSSDEIYQQARKFVADLDPDSALAQRPTLNGGTTPVQLKWLAEQLNDCRAAKSKAIVCGHIPVFERASKANKVAWNAQDILDVFWSFSDVVVLYMSGHYHTGGMAVDRRGIQHITIPAIVETPPGSNSMMTVEVYENSLRIVLGDSPWP